MKQRDVKTEHDAVRRYNDYKRRVEAALEGLSVSYGMIGEYPNGMPLYYFADVTRKRTRVYLLLRDTFAAGDAPTREEWARVYPKLRDALTRENLTLNHSDPESELWECDEPGVELEETGPIRPELLSGYEMYDRVIVKATGELGSVESRFTDRDGKVPVFLERNVERLMYPHELRKAN